jgi:hypothetical protein
VGPGWLFLQITPPSSTSSPRKMQIQDWSDGFYYSKSST